MCRRTVIGDFCHKKNKMRRRAWRCIFNIKLERVQCSLWMTSFYTGIFLSYYILHANLYTILILVNESKDPHDSGHPCIGVHLYLVLSSCSSHCQVDLLMYNPYMQIFMEFCRERSDWRERGHKCIIKHKICGMMVVKGDGGFNYASYLFELWCT